MAEGRKRRQEDGGEGEEEDVAPVDAVFSVAGGVDGEGGEASVATGGESRSGIKQKRIMSSDLLVVLFPPTEFCYVLRSCSKRMVDNLECTLGKNNFLVLLYIINSDGKKH